MNKYFELLYSQHSNMVYQTAYWILGNTQDAEDVVIEVFCKLYTCVKNNMDIRNIPGWLKVTAGTTAIDMIRKASRVSPELTQEAATSKDFVESLIKKIFADEMLRDLYRKNPKWFSYITMRYLLEMNYEEIALVEGVTPAAVKHAITRAKFYLSRKYASGTDILFPVIVLVLRIVWENHILD